MNASTKLSIAGWLIFTSSLAWTAQTVTVIHAGWLLAIPGEAPVQRQTLVIRDNRITQIEAGYLPAESIAPDAQLLDLSDRFVLPGLMDMHVHLLNELGPDSRSRQITDGTTLQAFTGAHHARLTLEAGFTTVRDLGGVPEAIFALREAIARGYVVGPRVIAAGSSLAATGGHGDVDGMRAELLDLWTPKTICDGAVDCRRATRYAIKYGADWIKITATGGVLSDTATGLGQQMTDDELEEIMNTAHGLGRKVAAHAHGTDGVNAALAAGVDSIDHGTFLDRESIRLFKRNNAYLVPTLLPGQMIPLTMQGNPFYTDAIREKALLAAQGSMASFALALEGGVNIAFGTDTGVTPHGRNAKEFSLMVQGGMTPMQAIRSATVSTAEMLDLSDDLGTLVPGKIADLIAVEGNPLENIALLEAVKTVIRDGRLIKNEP
ncbi:MAG: amidohydrolase family protein [Proteobacteria bacterium]|nr:amidohydrolase family protein [Pseudomonadota bacterium]